MQVTALGNVYNYGTVLLEILTTRLPVDEAFGEGIDLVKWVHSAPARGKHQSRYWMQGLAQFHSLGGKKCFLPSRLSTLQDFIPDEVCYTSLIYLIAILELYT